MRVTAFRDRRECGRSWFSKLEQAQELELVSSSLLTANVGRAVSVRAAAAPYRLRVQFSPSADRSGKVSLRVQPEVSLRQRPGRGDARATTPICRTARAFW